MKFTGKILSLLLASLMLAAPLTACKSGGSGDGTGTDLSTGTTAGGESETLPPRHDYMAANVSADVTLPRESYTNLSLQVPNSLKVEAEDTAFLLGRSLEEGTIYHPEAEEHAQAFATPMPHMVHTRVERFRLQDKMPFKQLSDHYAVASLWKF